MIKCQFFLGEYDPRRASSGNKYELHSYKAVFWTTNSFVLGTGTRELKAAETGKPKGGQFCRNPKSMQEALCHTLCPTFWPGVPEHILGDAIFCSQLMLYFRDTNCYNKVKTTFWKVRCDPDAFRSLSQELPSLYTSNGGRGVSLENLIPIRLCISFSLLTEQRPKQDTSQLSSWRTNRRGKGPVSTWDNHSPESPILLQAHHKATLEPEFSHGSGLLGEQ